MAVNPYTVVAGLHRATAKQGVCGLCGGEKNLTRTHIPPRCAYNSRDVRRQYLVSKGQELTRGRPSDGGLWVMGLCASCNQSAGKQYDRAYGDLARKLRLTWIRDWRFNIVPQIPVPQYFTLRPGAVVRSILIGMFGLNPNLRVVQPNLAIDLLSGSPFELPEGRELRLALFKGNAARISGAVGGFDALGPPYAGKRVGVMSDAQVYFPPLSWELADKASRMRNGTGFSSLLDAYEWADVSNWTTYGPDELRPLHNFFTSLPAVAHPKDMPEMSEGWIELVNDKISEILVSDLSSIKRL